MTKHKKISGQFPTTLDIMDEDHNPDIVYDEALIEKLKSFDGAEDQIPELEYGTADTEKALDLTHAEEIASNSRFKIKAVVTAISAIVGTIAAANEVTDVIQIPDALSFVSMVVPIMATAQFGVAAVLELKKRNHVRFLTEYLNYLVKLDKAPEPPRGVDHDLAITLGRKKKLEAVRKQMAAHLAQ